MTPRQEAARIGAMKYIGGPCQYGHEGLRYTGCGGCVECRYERHEARSDDVSWAKYLARPKTAIRPKPVTAWYALNGATYYAINRDRINALRRAWYARKMGKAA